MASNIQTKEIRSSWVQMTSPYLKCPLEYLNYSSIILLSSNDLCFFLNNLWNTQNGPQFKSLWNVYFQLNALKSLYQMCLGVVKPFKRLIPLTNVIKPLNSYPYTLKWLIYLSNDLSISLFFSNTQIAQVTSLWIQMTYLYLKGVFQDSNHSS